MSWGTLFRPWRWWNRQSDTIALRTKGRKFELAAISRPFAFRTNARDFQIPTAERGFALRTNKREFIFQSKE